MAAVDFANMSGKHPAVPMRPQGAPFPNVVNQTSDAQKSALAASAKAGLPPAPLGDKVNLLA